MTQNSGSAQFDAWAVVVAAAEAVGKFDTACPGRFSLDASGRLSELGRDDARAVLFWDPSHGWDSLLSPAHPQSDILELYLPISSATASRPITIGHLGQSLDGSIATRSGDSCSVTGPENILHLHRLRALCDAVVVGAGTVAADNPRLTTRLVSGGHPERVILDPTCRLSATHTVFTDGEAPTLRVCAAGNPACAEARARGENIMEIAVRGGRLDLKALLRQLRERGHGRIFVEGGGVTVSSFLEAGLLDRLHVAVAPLLIGDGRPTVHLPPQSRLQDCLRLQHRVYRAGNDILFDCNLRTEAHRLAEGLVAATAPTDGS